MQTTANAWPAQAEKGSIERLSVAQRLRGRLQNLVQKTGRNQGRLGRRSANRSLGRMLPLALLPCTRLPPVGVGLSVTCSREESHVRSSNWLRPSHRPHSDVSSDCRSPFRFCSGSLGLVSHQEWTPHNGKGVHTLGSPPKGNSSLQENLGQKLSGAIRKSE